MPTKTAIQLRLQNDLEACFRAAGVPPNRALMSAINNLATNLLLGIDSRYAKSK